jgi:hypothetical protein
LLRTQGKSCATKGVRNVNPEKKVATSVDSIAAHETPGQEEPILRYTSTSYQKILDFHVSEILLTTIILGLVLLLRLHH